MTKSDTKDTLMEESVSALLWFAKGIIGGLQIEIVKAIYQNMNGEITKFKEKRLWFEWMKDIV